MIQESIPAAVSSVAIEFLQRHEPQEMNQKACDFTEYYSAIESTDTAWLPKWMKYNCTSSSCSLGSRRSASNYNDHQPGGACGQGASLHQHPPHTSAELLIAIDLISPLPGGTTPWHTKPSETHVRFCDKNETL